MLHISFAKIDFKCPYCNKKYSDDNDVYLNRINKNKSRITTISCDCESKFGMTYNMIGEAVSFKLEKQKKL